MAAVTNDLYPKYIPDPVHCVNAAGKSILDLSHPAIYNITEKEGMTDTEKMQYKEFELYRLLQRMERRDNVFLAFTTTEYTNGSALQQYLGAPYPIIEPQPHGFECMFTIRWYEHVLSAMVGMTYFLWLRTKASTRWGGWSYSTKYFGMGTALCMDWGWSYRAWMRLTGQAPNDYECRKYGVTETSDRLKQKAENWRKYAEYKEEWMRRYNYYIWGMRPGETYSLMSCCMLPYKPVRYNTVFDYPMRKNPYAIRDTSLADMPLDNPLSFYYPKDDEFLNNVRPEVKYMGRRRFKDFQEEKA